MKNITLIIIITFFVSILGCSQCKVQNEKTNQAQLNMKKSLKGLAYEKFGNNFKIIHNNPKSYAIVLGPNIFDNKKGLDKTTFLIYNILENKIIFEDEIFESKIFWESDFVVRTGRVPGIIKKDDENPSLVGGYTFNVLTLKKEFN